MLNKLEDMRLKLGYRRQKDFAKFLGIHPGDYSRYANGVVVPSLEQAMKIAEKLNMRIEDIWQKE